MYRFTVLLFMSIVGLLCLPAIASEVPAVTAADFSGVEKLASSLWTIIAGEGPWGAVFLAVVGVLWKFGRPYLDEWVAARRLEKLYTAVEAAVSACYELYTRKIKEAVDYSGKLTADQIAEIRAECRRFIIHFMAAQGVDVLKEYGPSVIDMLCEWMLSKVKAESVAKAVIAPLPGLPSSSAYAAGSARQVPTIPDITSGTTTPVPAFG